MNQKRPYLDTFPQWLIQQENVIFDVKIGKPTLISSEFNAKVNNMQNMGILGASINIHTVRGVLASLVLLYCRKVGAVSRFPSYKSMGEILLLPYEILSLCFNYL